MAEQNCFEITLSDADALIEMLANQDAAVRQELLKNARSQTSGGKVSLVVLDPGADKYGGVFDSAVNRKLDLESGNYHPLEANLPGYLLNANESRIRPLEDVQLFRYQGEEDAIIKRLEYLSRYPTTFRVTTPHMLSDGESELFVLVCSESDRDSQVSNYKPDDSRETWRCYPLGPDRYVATTATMLSEAALALFSSSLLEEPLRSRVGGAECILISREAWRPLHLHDRADLWDGRLMRVDSGPVTKEFPTERFQRAAGSHGRILELIPDSPFKAKISEIETIQRDLDQLQDQLDYVSSIATPSERIFRFSDDDIEALVCAVRDLSYEDVARERVLWAKLASADGQAGNHYVLFKSESSLIGKHSPLQRWTAKYVKPAQTFRADPFWHRDYAYRCRSRVMVPDDYILYPRLHSWDPDRMDAYLSALAKRWSAIDMQSDETSGDIHDVIYLFENGDDNKMVMRVIDRRAFVPFPKQVDFFNLNMVFVREKLSQRVRTDTENKGGVFWDDQEIKAMRSFIENERQGLGEKLDRIEEKEKQGFEELESRIKSLYGDFDARVDHFLCQLNTRVDELEELIADIKEVKRLLEGAKPARKLKLTEDQIKHINRVLKKIDELERRIAVRRVDLDDLEP